MEQQQKCAIVTGGGRGLGRAICLKLAAEGYDLVTCYAHSASAAEETMNECSALGVRAIAVQADVSVEEDVAALFAKAKETFGRIDVLVNNAGITRDDLLLKMTADKFDEVIATNLRGSFLCTKVAAKEMLRQKSGRIIYLSSVVGIHGNAGQTNYAASKAGLIGLAKSTAKELGSRGITANVIAPGFMETEMTASLPEEVKKEYEKSIPLRRFGKAEDIADAVAFLASDAAGYITGQVLQVDGGMGM
ncbi:MAG: 3-oxoacyl-[acyl-carrier-protein] reductase [Lachnospiraceae bacterium]|nr:3-oxoacyl-[acyl-carrier-protein] reductase [Lachnospiraceae bacterium]